MHDSLFSFPSAVAIFEDLGGGGGPTFLGVNVEADWLTPTINHEDVFGEHGCLRCLLSRISSALRSFVYAWSQGMLNAKKSLGAAAGAKASKPGTLDLSFF